MKKFEKIKIKKISIGKKNPGCLIAAGITLLIYCIILAVKGIYPFGSRTIDYYDMAQQIAPFYYHVYDALHGTKAMFYDWYSALGTNMAMSTSGCSNLSPFNLFFLFIKRESLLQSLSVFNGIKLMCMSASMYFYLDKTHAKSPEFFKLVSSVGYSFCGFVLVLYITNQWVEIAVLFPLIMYFYDKLIEQGKITGYAITLAVTIIASYYLGFMILIFLFLYTGLKMIADYLWSGHRDMDAPALPVNEESDTQAGVQAEIQAEGEAPKGLGKLKANMSRRAAERKNRPKVKRTLPDIHLAELGIGTVTALAVSAFIVVPQMMQMLHSARFKNGSGEETTGILGGFIAKLLHVHGDYTTRWWSLLGISLAAAIILTGIIKYRKDRKQTFMSISMILLMVLELFFESINLFWHFGSYVQYPIRNGFIIYFVFAYLTCLYAARIYGEDAGSSEEVTGGENKWYLSFLFTVIGFLVFIGFYRAHSGMALRNVFHMTSAIMAVTFIFYLILFNVEALNKPLHILKKKRIEEEERTAQERINRKRYMWSAGVIACEVLCYGFLLFGKPDFITGYTEEPEQNGDYIYICEQLQKEFDFEPEYLFRVKNPDESLNANYGFVLARPALSNWTHMIAPGEQAAAASWGYSIEYTRLLDAGGTIFSDALLGVRNVISALPMDERLYEVVDQADIKVSAQSEETVTYYLYKPVYTLPFGVILNEMDEEAAKTEDTVDLHNLIYHSMIKNSDTDVASWLVKSDNAMGYNVTCEARTVDASKQVTTGIRVSDESALYLLGSGGDMEFANCTISVDDGKEEKTVVVPTIGDTDNIYYPAHFNNNAVYLGCFEDAEVTVTVEMDGNKGEFFDVDIMSINLDALHKAMAEYNGVADSAITAGGKTLSLECKADGEGQFLLLPVTYDKGWKIRVNGKRAKGDQYAGLFTIIPLSNGDNSVTMKFTPPGMRFGIFITVVVIILCIVLFIISKVRKEAVKSKSELALAAVNSKLNTVYAIAFLIVMFFMYVLPIVVGIISLLVRG